MIQRLVQFAVRQQVFIAGGVATLVVAGVWAFRTLPFEAFPDLTANSVAVIAEAPGMAPGDVEQLVTFPIERALLGLPRTESVRSTTKFGLSMVQVIFQDGVDLYFARQIVAERLGGIAGDLPSGVQPRLGPIATAMGEVYQYVLQSDDPNLDLTDLKNLQDYTIAPQLRTVAGVAEVNSWGGLVEQIHILADARLLTQASLSLLDVEAAVEENNRNFGGTYTEARGDRFVVRGEGRLRDAQDLLDIPVSTLSGVPVLVRDVALVERGALPRQGAVTYNGTGEVVAGMVIMQKGANALAVISGVETRIGEIRATLPNGVRLVTFYDQADLVNQTTHTIEKNLLLGATLVVVLLWGFLRSVSASILVAAVIPLSMLWAFISMRIFGFSANLMSLGALDFGLLVDGSVVVVENIARRAEDGGGKGVRERIEAAVIEVGRPVVFGISIILVVYLPIFALQGVERKMFVPMAFTVISALLGSLILALTVVPSLGVVMLKKLREPHTPRFDRMRDRYRDLLTRTLHHPRSVLLPAALLVVVAVASMTRLGTEFMPRLDEGSVLVQGIRIPSTALAEGVAFSRSAEEALLELPEVVQVVSKLGRPDLATEAMGTYESDTYVILRDRADWRPGGKDALLDEMDRVLSEIPGLEYAFTQPIQMRLDEAESGITTDVGVKVFGSDPDRLAFLAGRIEQILADIPGTADLKISAAARVRELRIEPNRLALARLGMGTGDLGHQVELALGARVATELVDGPRRVGVVVRLPAGNTLDPTLMATMPLATPQGGLVPLEAVADLVVEENPEAFAHEGGQRMVVVGANIRGRDVGSFVSEAQDVLDQAVTLPDGYSLEWGGQYKHQQSAARRLAIIGPASIILIFLLLFATFRTVRHSALILLNVPFALVGGIGALWISGLNLSTSAIIGFIAVFGIAVLNGVVMVSYINQLRETEPLDEAILDGAAVRLRPVLMTAMAAGLGFVPMALSSSPGAELQRPLATVVIGGVVTSTILTLLVLPTMYRLVERFLGKMSSA